MEYKYTINIINMNGREHFNFCLAEELKPLTRFINVDIASEYLAKDYLEEIRKVQTGESEPKTINGNGSHCRIKGDFVDIQDMFFDNETVTIETTELIKLIEAFVMERKKFQDSMNSDKK